MNDILIQAGPMLQADGIFDVVNNTAGLAAETGKVLLTAALWVGAVVQAFKAKFSFTSILVGILMVCAGLGFLSQLNVVKGVWSDTFKDSAMTTEQPSTVVAEGLDQPMVITVAQPLATGQEFVQAA
ncbi:hypothetical protein [Brachybacterium kimchii]|uniref:Uncharacterized protein n=1 Tax=Brachybacterium kimchii TaxID=2942909 RepID=A0ABY4ND25_9MICO|nr:hypothetical protein [Brachybacterium kimchii]UQN31811.1 hypothetical protein M4486_19670 [Brachybacterium kimchii]